MDPELIQPFGVYVTPAGQLIVCASKSNTVIQVNREGNTKLATIASQLIRQVSVCCNTNIQQIIVGLIENNKLIVMELQ
ncbi:hypothetical protein DPMN_033013 [Dreissena polymorpha]|uniref:Uncharacterized protein n=1 Tax=Dreissena polymorpha TaxID=45954 RepID=A0A9D4M2W6_DREPO|nr:hypothetical protein DPMN_033013 [Dreissena polymorpha]